MRKAGGLIALITGIVAVLAASGAAGAEPDAALIDPAPSDLPPGLAVLNTWYCLKDEAALSKLFFDSSGVQINNFAILEGKDMLVDAPLITVSASVVNRSNRYVGVSIEYVGIKDGHPLFAVVATPSLGIGPNRNEVVSGATFKPAGTLSAMTFGCVRVTGYKSAKDAVAP